MLILELVKVHGNATLEPSVFSGSLYGMGYDINLKGIRSVWLAAQKKQNRRAAASGTGCLPSLSVC